LNLHPNHTTSVLAIASFVAKVVAMYLTLVEDKVMAICRLLA